MKKVKRILAAMTAAAIALLISPDLNGEVFSQINDFVSDFTVYVSAEEGETDVSVETESMTDSALDEATDTTTDTTPDTAADNAEVVAQSDNIIDSGTCGANATWKLDSNGVLTISGNGVIEDTYSFCFFNDFTTDEQIQQLKDSVQSLVIEEGIIGIGWNAFYNFRNMTTVIFPESLEYISMNAFANSGLTEEVYIPLKVALICDGAFDGCNVTIKGYNYACDYAKRNNIPFVSLGSKFSPTSYIYGKCAGDGNVTAEYLLSYGEYLDFYGNGSTGSGYYGTSRWVEYTPWYGLNNAITSVTLDEGISDIGSWAFYNANNLEHISIYSTLTSIGEYAFYKCSKLDHIQIPSSVTYIGENAFKECADGFTIYAHSDYIKQYAKENNIKYIDAYIYNDILTLEGTVSYYGNYQYGTGDYDGAKYDWYTLNLDEPISYHNPYYVKDFDIVTYDPIFSSDEILFGEKTSADGSHYIPNEVISANGKRVSVKAKLKVWAEGFYAQKPILYDYEITVLDDTDSDYNLKTSLETEEVIIYNSIDKKYDKNKYSISYVLSQVRAGHASIDGLTVKYTLSDGFSFSSEENIKTHESVVKSEQLLLIADSFSEELNIYPTGEYIEELSIKADVYNGEKRIDSIESFVFIQKDYIAKYRGHETTVDKTLNFCYSDSFFDNDATEFFDQKLVQASLALELSSWTSYGTDNWTSNGNFKRDRNLVKLFNDLNFTDYESQKYDVALSNSDDSVAFGIARKVIKGSDEKETNLVAIAIRGGGYGAEWASNFNVGDNGKYANGFYNASTGVYNYVKDYISKYNLGSNTKIWITGYSRAAAVANLTAARLGNDFNNENIYAYTFATPQGYVFEWADNLNLANKDYNNIHNIINPADLVPTVAFSGWGFGRFGESHYIDYYSDNSAMKKIYRQQMNGKEYDGDKSYPDQVRQIDDLAILIAPTTTDYINKKIQYALWEALSAANSKGDMFDVNENGVDVLKLIYDILAKSNLSSTYHLENLLPDLPDAAYNRVALLYHTWTSSITNQKIVFPVGIFNGGILDQHNPETYIAWVFSTDSTSLYSDLSYKTAVIDCPVDVYVYNSSGTLVTSIVNDEIVKEDVNAAVFGDQKRIYLHDDTYRIKLVGNDTGTMDYSIEEYDSCGKMTRRTSIYDLPLEKGTTYTGLIDDIINTPAENYSLSDGNDNHNPEFDSNTSSGTSYTISVNGGIATKPFAYPGEQVTITALASKGTRFTGWKSSVALDDINSPIAEFIMPAADVEISALTRQVSGDDNDNNQYTPSGPTADNNNQPNSATPTTTVTPANSAASKTFNVKVENKITGKSSKVKATRTGENVIVNVGKENNGYYANLYTSDGELYDSIQIKSGKAKFTIQSDIDFYIVIDKYSHIEYEDVSSGAGIYELFEEKKEPFCMLIIVIAVLGFLFVAIANRYQKNKH